MKTITQTAEATDGQKKQIKRFGEDAIEKAIKELGLDNPGSQLVIEAGDEFSEGIYASTLELLKRLSTPNDYRDEEVGSNYAYLSGYKPHGIVPQTNRLRELFKGLGYANQDLLAQIENGTAKLPAGAEGWFALPNIWKKGGQPKIGATYSEWVQTVLNLIKETRNGKFYNYRDGSIDEKHLRQLAKVKKTMEAISEVQGNPDILIVAAQFGLRHRGRSVRRARAVMTSGEFGLGAFANGCMLLTHPERLQHYDDLWIDLAGDEFNPDGDGEVSRAPCLYFRGGEVGFGTSGVGEASGYCGAASGFLTQ